MARKSKKYFDSTLSTIMLRVNGDTEEFLDIVFDFMNRKTDFAKQDNILAKEKVMQAVDKHILPPKIEHSGIEMCIRKKKYLGIRSHWDFELFSSSNHISPLLNRPQGC